MFASTRATPSASPLVSSATRAAPKSASASSNRCAATRALPRPTSAERLDRGAPSGSSASAASKSLPPSANSPRRMRVEPRAFKTCAWKCTSLAIAGSRAPCRARFRRDRARRRGHRPARDDSRAGPVLRRAPATRSRIARAVSSSFASIAARARCSVSSNAVARSASGGKRVAERGEQEIGSAARGRDGIVLGELDRHRDACRRLRAEAHRPAAGIVRRLAAHDEPRGRRRAHGFRIRLFARCRRRAAASARFRSADGHAGFAQALGDEVHRAETHPAVFAQAFTSIGSTTMLLAGGSRSSGGVSTRCARRTNAAATPTIASASAAACDRA